MILPPCGTQRLHIPPVFPFQKFPERFPRRVIVAEEIPLPAEIAVLKLPVVRTRHVISHHVTAVLLFHVADELPQRLPRLPAVPGGSDGNLILAAVGGKIPFPHILFRQRRILHLHPRHEEGVRIHFQHLIADVVGKRDGVLSRPRLLPQRTETDGVDPHPVLPGQCDLGPDAFGFHPVASGDPGGGEDEIALHLPVAQQPRHAVDGLNFPLRASEQEREEQKRSR